MVFLSYTLAGQQEIKMSKKEYNKVKETILNTIINSPQFDSINSLYSDSTVIFAENEILYKGIPLTLIYKNRKVKIVDCSQIKENCYWVGDFTIDIYTEKPKNARVQIVLVLKNKEDIIIGITLQKAKKWQIKNFAFVE